MPKKDKSKRNRHTGKINAFKETLLQRGKRGKFDDSDTVYRISKKGTMVKE